VSALIKVAKIKVIRGKFKIYWKSLLILLIQRDLQRQKFAKAEIRPRHGMEYGTLLIIPFEATRYAVLSFQNSARYTFLKRRALKYTTGWQREIEMIRFRRIKKALCSLACGALGKNSFGRYLHFNHIPRPFASHSERYITFINEVE